MAGTPLKTAKKLTKLKMLLDCALNAVIDETPERYTDMYELAEPLPEGDSIGEHYFAMWNAAYEALWQVERLLENAKANLSAHQLSSLSQIESVTGHYPRGRFELAWI